MRWTVWVAVTMALACGRGDVSSAEALDGNDSAVTDVIGRPEGADAIPPEMRGRDAGRPAAPESLPPRTGNRQAETPADSEFKRPERRPVRTVPPLTRPDTTQ